MEYNKSVSFVIVHWNLKNLLYECLSSINETTIGISKEIIIIDNASTDDSEEYIKKRFSNIIWLQNETNLGYAKAVNQGVGLSHGNLIFLLNNDVKLTTNATEKLISFLAETPDAGAVAPLLYYPDGRFQVSCRRFPAPSALLLEYLDVKKIGKFRRWKLNIEEHLKGGKVPQPMTSAMLIRRECWDAVGPLDERFPIFFNDVDWCYRLYKDTNYKIYLYPDVRVIHHVGATVNRLGLRKKYEFYKGLIRFYLKHFPFKAEIKS